MQTTTRYESRRQLADRSGLSERTYEKLALDGGGPPFVKVGRRVLYPVDEADAWLKARMVRSTSEQSAA